MSLILDALNKADNERKEEAPPSLSSEHDLSLGATDSSKAHKLIYVLVCTVILLLALTMYLVVRGSGTETQSPTNIEIAATKTQALKTKPADADNPEPENNTRLTQTTVEARSSTYEQMQKKLIEAQYQRALSPEEDTTKETSSSTSNVKQQIASIYKTNDSDRKKPPVKPKPTTPKTNKVKTLNDYPTLSFIGELSHSEQRNIPTLMYREHVHNGKASFVMLNNSKREKGQLVADNIFLDEILPDGIILRFESKRFKMKALNSWVNI